MAKILENKRGVDQTIQIFDSFYAFNTIVNANEFDIVNGYFLQVCETKNIAGNFTVAIFRIAQETGVSALELLDIIKGKTDTSKLNMNKTICYFLNTLKSKTALYGVSQVPKPNQPVSRNILQ